VSWKFPKYPEDWDSIRKATYTRAGGRCERCGRSGQRLHAHHRVPLSKGGSNSSYNLECLCEDCHRKEHPHMKRSPYSHMRMDYSDSNFSRPSSFFTKKPKPIVGFPDTSTGAFFGISMLIIVLILAVGVAVVINNTAGYVCITCLIGAVIVSAYLFSYTGKKVHQTQSASVFIDNEGFADLHCPICHSKIDATSEMLLRNPTITCSTCGIKFNSTLKSQKWFCDYCNAEFPNLDEVEKHEEICGQKYS